MKSIIISAAITIVMVIALIASSVYISITLSTMERQITEYEITDNYEEIAKDFERLLGEYRKKIGFLSLLLKDSLIVEIENGFLDVISYAECEDYVGVASSAARLNAGISSVRVLSEFSLRSIF